MQSIINKSKEVTWDTKTILNPKKGSKRVKWDRTHGTRK